MKANKVKKYQLRQKIFISITTVLIFILVTEIIAGIIGVRESVYPRLPFAVSENDETLTPDVDLFWRRRQILGYSNSMGLRGDEIKIPKPPNSFRILCLGDSSTEGAFIPFRPVDEAYAQQLERMLNSRIGTRRFDVINAGISGYTSQQGLNFLKKIGLSFEPDIITVMFGNNEVILRGQYTDKEVWQRRRNFGNLQKVLHKSRAYLLLRQCVLAMSDLMCKNGKGMELKPRVPVDDYKENLEEIIKVARASGAKVILLTVPVNLYHPPKPSRPVPPIIAAKLNISNENLNDSERSPKNRITTGRENDKAAKQLDSTPLTSGKSNELAPDRLEMELRTTAIDTAMARFRESLVANPERAMPYYNLGMALLLKGEKEQAKSALEKAVELDPFPERTKKAYNAAAREIAAKFGVQLVDIKRKFDEECDFAPDRKSKASLFADKMHPNIRGHTIIAEELYNAITFHHAEDVNP